MSTTDTQWAYSLSFEHPSQKAVLLALAHCRNGKTGRCFPSQQELASMSGFSLAAVRKALGVLVALGAISRTKTTKGKYRSNDEYTLHYDYRSTEVPLTSNTTPDDHRSSGSRPVLLVSESGATHEGAVEPTGKEPEVNRKVAAKRGSRIPDDFTVTPAMITWARENAPLVDGPRATQMFRNYWTAATGSNATKLDWPATWRNWMLRDQQTAERAPKAKQSPEERMRATLSLVPDSPMKEIS